MKKFLTSKPFLITTLSVLCIAVVAVCLFLNMDQGPEFIPEPPQQSESVSDWAENSGSTQGTTPPTTNTPAQEQEAFPKVVEDDGKDVVIEFTPPQSSEAEAPEAPAGKTEIEQPQQKPDTSHPVTPDPNVKPPEQKPQQPSGPAPGSTNDKGQVYDAAFGWVTPSKTTTIPSDNDGDPDKMVGSMD